MSAPYSSLGLVLAPGPAGRCDDWRVGGAVVEPGADGLWRMWYYGRDRAFDPAAPATLGSGRIAFATSRDGIQWTRHEGHAGAGAVLGPADDPGAFDSLHVGLTDVSRHDGAWWMWTFGGDRSVRKTQAAAFAAVVGLGMRCGLARSADGVTWQRCPGSGPGGSLFDIDPDAVYAAWPNAIWADGRWVLQYTAPSLDMRLYPTRAMTSPDGRNWQRFGFRWAEAPPPYAVTGIITRHVLANPLSTGRRWLMVYTGTDAAHKRAIAAADSDDLAVWHPLGDRPIFAVGAPGAWDDFGVAATRLVPHDGRLRLYYYGFQSLTAADTARGIGLAISDGGLWDFRRVAVP